MKFHLHQSSSRNWISPNFIEVLLFLCLSILGVYFAITAGISSDEEVEYNTYLLNISAIRGLIEGDLSAYQNLSTYHDRYYGVGFHLISYSLSSLLLGFNHQLLEFSSLGSRLAWNHAANLIAFLGAGIVFRASLILLTHDRLIATLGMFTFLSWPYLMGHGLMNVKDVPFLLAWLCCTYQVLVMISRAENTSEPWMLRYLVLGVLTGWLISIRVSGILIFIEYAWLGIFFGKLYLSRDNFRNQWRFSVQLLTVFVLSTVVTLFIFYPILWHNPLELFNAITYMSNHPWQGSTLTAGEYIEPKSKITFYLFSWLWIKLPLIAILGLVAIPWMLYIGVKNNKLTISNRMTLCLVLSIATILLLLIQKRVGLYNELRQILFIFPLILLVSIASCLMVSRKLAIGALLCTNLYMLGDNINLHPYQYTYINEIARHNSLASKYESDYFGLSIAKTAEWLNGSTIDGIHQCLYVPSPHQWKYYLNPYKFPCMGGYPGDLSLIKTPFLFFVQPRANERYAAPAWCELKHEEVRVPLFSGVIQRMGELYECTP